MTATHRADSGAAPGPHTPTGRYLRATALNARPDEIPGAPDAGLLAAAFGSVVRLRFRADSPLPAIAGSVAAAAAPAPAPWRCRCARRRC